MGKSAFTAAIAAALIYPAVEATLSPVSAAPLPAAGTKQSYNVYLNRSSLRRGDTGPDVVSLQRALDRYGYAPGAFDGVYGPATEAAVSEFQRRNDLWETGEANRITLEELGFVLPNSSALPPPNAVPALPAAAPPPPLPERSQISRGSTGSEVRDLQRTLNSNGASLVVDGIYGPATENAVRAFQTRRGLPATGIADSRTLSALGTVRGDRYLAIIPGSGDLSAVRRVFGGAVGLDRSRRGEFINLGEYDTRSAAEAQVDRARSYGFDARVIYQ